jgi:hypothetical protein
MFYRDCHGSGPGTQIEDLSRCFAVPVKKIKGSFHENFRIRPGYQDMGGNHKIQTPEFPAAQNAGYTFTGKAAVKELGEAAVLIVLQGFRFGKVEFFFFQSRDFRQEEGSVKPGGIYTAGFKPSPS